MSTGKFVWMPTEPSPELIDQGAQGIASFDDGSAWPESWDENQVLRMRHEAADAYRYMLAGRPKLEDLSKEDLHELANYLRRELALVYKRLGGAP